MAIQLAAGNYWRIRDIRLNPITFQVSVVVNIYKDVAAFTADPDVPVGFKILSFPQGTFANNALTNIQNSVEAKLLLQPEFTGGVIVA